MRIPGQPGRKRRQHSLKRKLVRWANRLNQGVMRESFEKVTFIIKIRNLLDLFGVPHLKNAAVKECIQHESYLHTVCRQEPDSGAR